MTIDIYELARGLKAICNDSACMVELGSQISDEVLQGLAKGFEAAEEKRLNERKTKIENILKRAFKEIDSLMKPEDVIVIDRHDSRNLIYYYPNDSQEMTIEIE